jgi:hypothetical protein
MTGETAHRKNDKFCLEHSKERITILWQPKRNFRLEEETGKSI